MFDNWDICINETQAEALPHSLAQCELDAVQVEISIELDVPSIMSSPDVRIAVYSTILLLVGFSDAETPLCSFPLNCNVESTCYIGSLCVCPAGYARLSMCDGMGVVAEECHEYMEEGFICYPENACLGPNEQWKKTGLLSLVCARKDNLVRRELPLFDRIKSRAKVNPFLALFVASAFILKAIHWAMHHEKEENYSENLTEETA